MSIVSGTLGAVNSAKSARDADKTNRKNAQATNKLNLQMFNENRGSKGSAVLPLYLKGNGGGLFEEQLGADLTAAYTETAKPMSAYQSVAGRNTAMQAAATKAAGGIFDGTNQTNALANFEPVKTGRVAFRRGSAIEALNKTLGEIEANQAARGNRANLGSNMLRFKANQATGDAMGDVAIQNLEEERAIRDYYGIQAPLQSLDVPYSIAQRELATFQLPEDAYLDALGRRLQPLQFTRIGSGQPFQYQAMPTVNPNTSAGQLAAMAIGQTGGTLLNYKLQEKARNDYLAAIKQQQVANAGGAAAAAAAVPAWAGSSYGGDFGGSLGYTGGAAAAGSAAAGLNGVDAFNTTDMFAGLGA